MISRIIRRFIVKNWLITLLKGGFVGSTMLVPGVSGGSMAMIIGIYDKLINAVSSFTKDIKKNILFLLVFAGGAGVGAVIFANPILSLIERFPKPMLYFFIGAVAGGIPLMIKQSTVKKFSWKLPLYIVLGGAIVISISFIPTGGIDVGGGIAHYLLLLFAGFISAVALVLPGISVSYMFLVLGIYEQFMDSVSTLYLPFLVPLGVGLIIGIFMTTKILDTAMKKYPVPVYFIILGFLLGSVF